MKHIHLFFYGCAVAALAVSLTMPTTKDIGAMLGVVFIFGFIGMAFDNTFKVA